MSEWNTMCLPASLESSEFDEDLYLSDHYSADMARGSLYGQPIDESSLSTADEMLYSYYECSSEQNPS